MSALSFVFALICLFWLATVVVLLVGTSPLRLWYDVRDRFWRILFFWRRSSASALPEPDWAAAADEVGFFDPLDHILLNVSAWTPEEREAYGVNATDILIDAIDKELKSVEWQRLTNARLLPATPVREYETATEKAIRRNGAQIVAGVLDKPKDVWAGPAPSISTTQIFR